MFGVSGEECGCVSMHTSHIIVAQPVYFQKRYVPYNLKCQ